MKREYDFKLWRGWVKFFAYTPLAGIMIEDGAAYGYDRSTLFDCDCLTLGMDGVAGTPTKLKGGRDDG
ncbi:hypothetical protein [Shinella sp.]|uniref:hypothetical protein n=1 Tax=Shinella sp. TaxID=1870904 RepID=UPI0028ABF658|nr:hypothetical protein [Shinella sp.]